MIRKKTDSGWWEGELQAKGRKRQVGWFPASYVKILNSSGRISGRTTPVSTTRIQQEVVIGEPQYFYIISLKLVLKCYTQIVTAGGTRDESIALRLLNINFLWILYQTYG